MEGIYKNPGMMRNAGGVMVKLEYESDKEISWEGIRYRHRRAKRLAFIGAR